MCDRENNDVKHFFSQLSLHFSPMILKQNNDLSCFINVYLGQINRKVRFSRLNNFVDVFFLNRLNLFLFHFIRYLLLN